MRAPRGKALAGSSRAVIHRDVDIIRIAGIKSFGHHGALPEEKRLGQRFTVSVDLEVDTRPAAAADDLVGRVEKELVGDDGDLLKGGIVVYTFAKAYDYSAFWQEVVGVERPRGIVGHAGVSGDVAYGALTVAADDADTRLLLAEQISAAALAGRELPGWFVRGAARAVAVRIVPKAALAQEWKQELPLALDRVGGAKAYFAGQADASTAAVVGGGFVATIATGARLRQVVEIVDGGGSFDDAFAKVFRAQPADAFDAWAAKAARGRGRGR